MQRESTLNANAVRSTTDSERFTDRTVTTGDNNAFESLQALTAAFNDLHENANGVTNVKRGNIRAELGALDGTDDLIHGMGLLPLKDVLNQIQAEDRPMSQVLL